MEIVVLVFFRLYHTPRVVVSERKTTTKMCQNVVASVSRPVNKGLPASAKSDKGLRLTQLQLTS